MFASEFSPPDAFAPSDLSSKRSVLGTKKTKKWSHDSADYQREQELIWHFTKSFRNETRTKNAIAERKKSVAGRHRTSLFPLQMWHDIDNIIINLSSRFFAAPFNSFFNCWVCINQVLVLSLPPCRLVACTVLIAPSYHFDIYVIICLFKMTTWSLLWFRCV